MIFFLKKKENKKKVLDLRKKKLNKIFILKKKKQILFKISKEIVKNVQINFIKQKEDPNVFIHYKNNPFYKRYYFFEEEKND